MDPLQPLYELFDSMQVRDKPPLRDTGMPVETPVESPEDHPVTQQKKEVDELIDQGASPADAHQKVNGQIDTSDVDSKAKFASTLGRKQSENSKRGVRIEKDSDSLLAQEMEIQKNATPENLKTPIEQEMQQTTEEFDKSEEIDYNDDVQYLRTYGRA